MSLTWQLTLTQLDESLDVGLSVSKLSCLPMRVEAEVCLQSDHLSEAHQGAPSLPPFLVPRMRNGRSGGCRGGALRQAQCISAFQERNARDMRGNKTAYPDDGS